LKENAFELVYYAYEQQPYEWYYDDIEEEFGWNRSTFGAVRRQAVLDLTYGIDLSEEVSLAPGEYTIVPVPNGPNPWPYKLTADPEEIALWGNNRRKDAQTRVRTMRHTAVPLRTNTDGRTKRGRAGIEAIIRLNAIDRELTSVGSAFIRAMNGQKP
jgi:hypothetical protein